MSSMYALPPDIAVSSQHQLTHSAADPLNQIAGRRGAILVAAVLITGTSLGAALLQTFDEAGEGRSDAWRALTALRLVNGIGMGIKAVSTPILASETAIGYWRGLFLPMLSGSVLSRPLRSKP